MGWTAITTAGPCKRQDGKIISLLVDDGDVIYKGMIVRINADGYATVAAPANGDMAAGIALETVDNSAGADGDKSVRVQTEGVCVVYHKGGFATTDIGNAAVCAHGADESAHYVDHDQLFSVTDHVICGTVLGPYVDPVTGAADGAEPYRGWIKLHCLKAPRTT